MDVEYVLRVVVVNVATLWIIWRAGSWMLRFAGWWVMVVGVVMVMSGYDGSADSGPWWTPYAFIVFGAVALGAGHGLWRLRHGYWKPRWLEDRMAARRTRRMPPSGASLATYLTGDAGGGGVGACDGGVSVCCWVVAWRVGWCDDDGIC